MWARKITGKKRERKDFWLVSFGFKKEERNAKGTQGNNSPFRAMKLGGFRPP